MNTKYNLKNTFLIFIFFTFTCVFASINNNIKNENFQDQDKELLIYKKNEKDLDVYTFTPKNQLDKELINAVENRLKTINKGVVSFSADEKNLVTLLVDPAVISEDELENTLAIVVKVHGYYSSDYKIIEL